MKCVIVELGEQQVVVLREDGTFDKMERKPHMELGDQIPFEPLEKPVAEEKKPQSKIHHMRRWVSIAAAFVVVLLGGFVYTMRAPNGYVDIRINPSVSVTTNLYGQVIGVEGVNEDGIAMVEKYGIQTGDLMDCVDAIVDAAVEDGYLSSELENAIKVIVSQKDSHKAQELERQILEHIDQKLKEKYGNTVISVSSLDYQDHQSLKSELEGHSSNEEVDRIYQNGSWKQQGTVVSISEMEVEDGILEIELSKDCHLSGAKVIVTGAGVEKTLTPSYEEEYDDELYVDISGVCKNGEIYTITVSGAQTDDNAAVENFSADLRYYHEVEQEGSYSANTGQQTGNPGKGNAASDDDNDDRDDDRDDDDGDDNDDDRDDDDDDDRPSQNGKGSQVKNNKDDDDDDDSDDDDDDSDDDKDDDGDDDDDD